MIGHLDDVLVLLLGIALLLRFTPRAVLGRLAARLVSPVRPGERCVVVGWPLGEDGRKLYSGTALYGEGGALKAFARATWIKTA